MRYEIELGFRWQVPVGQFRWVDETTLEDTGEAFHLEEILVKDALEVLPPWLIGPAIQDQPQTVIYHDLRELPGLHRTFAALPFDKEAILEFAQNYGQLTKGVVLVRGIGKGGTRLYRAEPLRFWFWEIQRMKDAVYLLDLLQETHRKPNGASRLEKVIRWKEDDGVYFCPFGEDGGLVDQAGRLEDFYQMAGRRARKMSGRDAVRTIEEKASHVRQEISQELKEVGRFYLGKERIAGPDFHSARFFAWKESREVAGPAWFMLSRMVSEKLAGKINIEATGDEEEFTVHIVPRDLLSALWMGLLFEILGKIKLKQCPICGTWFDAGRAPRRVFCDKRGSGCRQRASRLRKRLRALVDEGKTREEAARALELSPDLAEFLLKA